MSTALVLAIAFDLGLRQSGAWVIGQEPAADPAVTTHLMALWLVLGAAGVLACWLMLEAGGYVAGYGALALVAALNVAPMLCLRTGQGVFLGRGDLGRLNRSELISRAVVLAGTIGLWALGLLDLATAIWVLLAAHVAAAVYLLWQVSGAIRPATLFQPALVARMFRYGAELWIAILLLILLGRIGFWIVSWQLGEDALGIYFGSQRLGEILVEVATAVGIVIFSYGVRATDIKASALDAIRIARLVTALMALVALVALLLARPLLGLVLGPGLRRRARRLPPGDARCARQLLHHHALPLPLRAGPRPLGHRRLRHRQCRGGRRVLAADAAPWARRRRPRLRAGASCRGGGHRHRLPSPLRLRRRPKILLPQREDARALRRDRPHGGGAATR